MGCQWRDRGPFFTPFVLVIKQKIEMYISVVFPTFPFLAALGEQPADGLHERLQDILAAGLQVGSSAAPARGRACRGTQGLGPAFPWLGAAPSPGPQAFTSKPLLYEKAVSAVEAVSSCVSMEVLLCWGSCTLSPGGVGGQRGPRYPCVLLQRRGCRRRATVRARQCLPEEGPREQGSRRVQVTLCGHRLSSAPQEGALARGSQTAQPPLLPHTLVHAEAPPCFQNIPCPQGFHSNLLRTGAELRTGYA